MNRCLRPICLTMMTALLAPALLAKPNIIFLLADDQRNDVLGCYGNTLIQTPTLDRLASEGVRFNQVFCQVPICAASRATLFTGLSLRTHGHNFGELPVSAAHMATSYPMVLKEVGYRIGFAGKYGVAFATKAKFHQAFDFFKPIGRAPYLKTMPAGSLRHETDLCIDAAIKFIKTNPADTPFCMSVSFNASHAEDKDLRPGYHFQWPESSDGLYETTSLPGPKLGDEKYFTAMPSFLQKKDELSRQRFFWRWDTPEKYQKNLRAYYRMITGIDTAIARLLEELKAEGLAENTVIIYSADNGFMMGDRGIAGKWNHYDESLRIPLIIYDPRLPPDQRGRVVEELVNNMDMAPTFVDLAGVEIPERYQGVSLVPWLEGIVPTDWREETYCEHYFSRYNDWYGLRGKRYKYVVYYDEPDGPVECLYDLQNDPTELTNLATNPEYDPIRKEWEQRLEGYLTAFPEAKARVPVPK